MIFRKYKSTFDVYSSFDNGSVEHMLAADHDIWQPGHTSILLSVCFVYLCLCTCAFTECRSKLQEYKVGHHVPYDYNCILKITDVIKHPSLLRIHDA
jgi:hypothetical protein